jgi:hypothetical protein
MHSENKTVSFRYDEKLLAKVQKRLDEISPALFLLDKWLADCLRLGILRFLGNDEATDEIAKQMIDGKAKGFEEKIREIDWHGELSEIAEKLSELAFAVEILKQKEKLSPAELTEIVSFSGLDKRKEDVKIASDERREVLIYLGCEISQERNNLYERKSWFWAETAQQFVFLSEFRHGNADFPARFEGETAWLSDIYFYYGLFPERILADGIFTPSETKMSTFEQFPFENNFLLMQKKYAQNCGKWFFRQKMPFILDVKAVGKDAKSAFFLSDVHGNCVKISEKTPDFWTLASAAAQKTAKVFGIWDGKTFLALSFCLRSEIFLLHDTRLRLNV